jgi:hypothetical protein
MGKYVFIQRKVEKTRGTDREKGEFFDYFVLSWAVTSDPRTAEPITGHVNLEFILEVVAALKERYGIRELVLLDFDAKYSRKEWVKGVLDNIR